MLVLKAIVVGLSFSFFSPNFAENGLGYTFNLTHQNNKNYNNLKKSVFLKIITEFMHFYLLEIIIIIIIIIFVNIKNNLDNNGEHSFHQLVLQQVISFNKQVKYFNNSILHPSISYIKIQHYFELCIYYNYSSNFYAFKLLKFKNHFLLLDSS